MKLLKLLKKIMARRKIRIVKKVSRNFDTTMIATGYKQYKRRQFWRDFISNTNLRVSFTKEEIK